MTDNIEFELIVRDPVKSRTAQVRESGVWSDITLPAAEAIEVLKAQVEEMQDRITVISASILELSAELPNQASALAQRKLLTSTVQNADGIISTAADVTALEANVADNDTDIAAGATATQALVVRVETNEMGVESAATAITDLRIDVTDIQTDVAGNTTDITANATAATVLLARVVVNEGNITSTASDVTVLEGTVTVLRTDVDGNEVDITANATATTALTGRVTVNEQGIVTITQDIVDLRAEIDGTEAVAIQELTARVELVENLDGTTTVAGLARWTVKLAVNDLVGGIGLLNDGTNIDLIIAANRMAIVPPGWTGADDERRIPFAVTNGIVYLDNAAIRDASILGAKIGTAVITSAHIVDATIQVADIEDLNVFDLTASGSIQSDNFVTGTSGYRLTKVGVEFAVGVLGTLASTNFETGLQGWQLRHTGGGELNDVTFRGTIQSTNFSAGSTGWQLLSSGFGELDAALIRGTLSADHIDSDVFNVKVLWTGSQALDNTSASFTLEADWAANYDALLIQGVATGEGLALSLYVDINLIPDTTYSTAPSNTTAAHRGYILESGSLGANLGRVAWFAASGGSQIGFGIKMRVWKRTTSTAWIYTTGANEGVITKIIGLKDPGVTTDPVDPPDPSTTAPGLPTNLRVTTTTTSSISLACTAPTSGDDPTTYRWRYSTNSTVDSSDPSVTSTGTSRTITGLSEDTDYWFSVQAENSGGVSGYTTGTVTDSTDTLVTPPTPTGLSATNTQMQVDDTVNTYYTTFQYDDNGSFSSPVYIYDNFLSTIHNAAWLAPAGSTWYRARFNTAPNGGGTHGSWTPDNIHGNF